MINRRSLITGIVSVVCAPAIVPIKALMPVKSMISPEPKYCMWVGARSILIPKPEWFQTKGIVDFDFVNNVFRGADPTEIIRLGNLIIKEGLRLPAVSRDRVME